MTSVPPGCTLEQVTWTQAREALASVRSAVFVIEQGVPEALEWDECDARAIHLLAVDDRSAPVGTGRLLDDGRIGRMAVVSRWRGKGIGAAILSRLIQIARARGDDSVHLHAQTHALDFYARHGFVATGPEFLEAGIPHRAMTLSLP